jgi:hypothetical protein
MMYSSMLQFSVRQVHSGDQYLSTHDNLSLWLINLVSSGCSTLQNTMCFTPARMAASTTAIAPGAAYGVNAGALYHTTCTPTSACSSACTSPR